MMKLIQQKKTHETKTVPGPDAATLRAIMARTWKPEASSLKREEWRQIVLERLG